MPPRRSQFDFWAFYRISHNIDILPKPRRISMNELPDNDMVLVLLAEEAEKLGYLNEEESKALLQSLGSGNE
jgi:hypothetical protein